QVARHRLDPHRRDADQGARKVVVGEADALEHRPRRRTVDAVRQLLAVPLRGMGLVVDAHASRAPSWATRTGSTCVSEGRSRSSSATTVETLSRSAHTTTDGPEPESVTAAAPEGRPSRS